MPLTDTNITKWNADYTGADTNSPTGATSMAGVLDDELRNIKSVVRAESESKQWERWGLTPTYVSATQFTLAGDQRTSNGGPIAVNRRIKATVTAGTVYGYISVVAYTSLTTITVVMDGASALDSGLSEVAYGALTEDSGALPQSVETSDHSPFYAETSGTNTYTATLGCAIAAYQKGRIYYIKFTVANTGSATLNLNGVGATGIHMGGGGPLTGGEIVLNTIIPLMYDGTHFQIPVDGSGTSIRWATA